MFLSRALNNVPRIFAIREQPEARITTTTTPAVRQFSQVLSGESGRNYAVAGFVRSP